MKNEKDRKVNQQDKSKNQRSSHAMARSKRKQFGNSLVPVVIGIAITAVATASFLNQGADVASRNKVSLAASEITTMLYDWNLLRTTNAANVIGVAGAGNPPAPTNMNGGTNIFGIAVNAFAGGAAPALTFTTDDPVSCAALSGIFDVNVEGVANSACADSVLTITLN